MGQVLKIGDYAQDNIDGVRNISCEISNNNFMTFQFPQGTFYQVPTTAKFYVCELKIQVATAQTEIQLGYADDTVDDSAVPPTNPVYLAPPINIDDAMPMIANSFFLEVPEEKYLFLTVVGGSTVAFIEGVEL